MQNNNRTVALAAAGLVLIGAPCALAQDWPQWRGVNRDAKVSGFTAPKEWPKELAQKWKINVGSGDASPTLVGDRLYLFTRQGGSEVTLCLNAADGKEIWGDRYEVQGSTGPSSGHAGPRCSPAVAEGKVVTLGVRGTLSCFDAAKGTKLWRKDDFAGAWPRFFTASSPIIVDGLCIAELGGPSNGGIVAYDLNSGEQKWKWTGDSPAYASPVMMTVGGTKLIVTQTDSKMVALTAADGKLAWESPFAVQGRGYNASTPIVDGQTLIYTGSGRGTKAVKIEKQGDTFTAKELWSNAKISAQFNTPVLKNGLLFGLTQAGEYFCLNAQTGETAWTAPAAGAETSAAGAGAGGAGRGRGGGGGGGYGSIVDAGSVLLALTPKSQLVVLEPSDKALKEVASIKVADTATYAYPIIAGNRIYIKDQESLTLWSIQ